MKKKLIGLMAAFALICLPLAAAAAQQGGMQGMSEQGSMQGMNMKGMVVLGTVTENGVKAMGHLMTMSQSMGQSGMAMTHHFMVMFNDEKSGAPIVDGLVALKVTNPGGITGAPIRLMPMTMGMVKGFGAGVKLAEKGTYKFEVACKLADGHKRQFYFQYAVK